MQQTQQGFDFTGFFSFQLEVLMRKDFGERFHHISFVFLVLAWLAGLTTLFYLGIRIDRWQAMTPDPVAAFLFGSLTVAFALKSISQAGDIWGRHRTADSEIHSWSSGKALDFWFSFLPFENDLKGQHTVKRFFEPLPFFLIGAFLYLYVSGVFGAYLLILAASMMLKSFSRYFTWRNMRLDLADGPLLHQTLVDTKSSKDTADTSAVSGSRPRNSHEDLDLSNIMDRLDPALLAMMEDNDPGSK